MKSYRQSGAGAEPVCVVQLKRPYVYKLGDEERQIDSVELREPTVGDLRALDKESSDTARAVRLVSLLSGLPVPCVERMAARDFRLVSEAVEGLLGKDAPGAREGSPGETSPG